MAIAGVTLPTIDITLTLPTTRTDGTALALTEIASATVLRDPGTGPVSLQVLSGPFSGATALFSDVSPATGSDIYSFFVTDTAGTIGVTSTSVTVTVTGVTPLAQPSAGTLTAIARAATGATPVPGPVVVPGVTPSVGTQGTPFPSQTTGFPNPTGSQTTQGAQPIPPAKPLF